jgi:hypothetical protein
MEASEGGKIPIVCDTSPCLSQIKVRRGLRPVGLGHSGLDGFDRIGG